MAKQMSFNGTDYGFKWTTDWYEWDYNQGNKAAMEARNAEAKLLRKAGFVVRCSAQESLMSKGGIGSGHPHIELWCKSYTLFAN